jgi:hypothetical protein
MEDLPINLPTIHRHMSSVLKKEKKILNEEI